MSTPPPGQPRAAVGRADVLRLMQHGGDDEWQALAAWLGMQPKAQPKAWASPPEPPAPTAPPVALADVGAEAPPAPREVLRANLYTVTAHERLAPEPEALPSTDAAAPAFAQPLRANGAPEPTPTPLVPARRMAAYLRRCLRQRGTSPQLDVLRWVQQVAQGQPVRHPPRLRLPGWHHGSVLLIDADERTSPLRIDLHALAAQALRLSGGQVQVYWHARPGACWRAQVGARQPSWQAVLALPRGAYRNGLLVGLAPESAAHMGPALLGKLLHAQATRHWLQPAPPQPSQVHSGTWQHTLWDTHQLLRPRKLLARAGGGTGARAGQGGDAPSQTELATQDHLAPLLAALSLAVRIEPALLRAVRQHLDLPVGAEVALWAHPDIESTPLACQLRPDCLAHHRAALVAQPLPQRQALARLIEAHHRHLSPLIHMEEAALAHTLAPGALPASPAWAQAARTLCEAPESPAAQELARYVGRTGARTQAQPAVWAGNPALAETWVRAHEPQVRQGLPVPEGLPPAVVHRVLDGPAAGTVRQSWHLVQWGEALWVAPLDSSAAIDEFIGELPYHALATLHTTPLPSGLVLSQGEQPSQWVPLRATTQAHHTGDPSTQCARPGWLALTPPGALPGVGAPAQPWHLRTAFDELTVKAIPRPGWVHAWGRDANRYYVAPWGDLRLIDAMSLSVDHVHDVQAWQTSAYHVESPYAAWRIGADKFGCFAEVIIESVTQIFRWIEPGSFWMGSPDDEPERYENEGPYHHVTLTEGFWLADTACMQAFWQAVMGENPSHFQGETISDLMRPVERVSWHDVQRFLDKLQALLPGVQPELPTEAQWEYACRAGTDTPYSFGENISPRQVNYDGNYPYNGALKGEYREQTWPLKLLPANAWGLYEMHGNVWEWCADGPRDYSAEAVVDPVGPSGQGQTPNRQPQDKTYAEREAGGQRALRGGSWVSNAGDARSANRNANDPGKADGRIGFRIALRSTCSGSVGQESPDRGPDVFGSGPGRPAAQGSGAAERPPAAPGGRRRAKANTKKKKA